MILWYRLTPEKQAEIRRWMGPMWEPPTFPQSNIETHLKLESPEEIGKIMSRKPESKKELEDD